MTLQTTAEMRLKRIPFMENMDVKHVSIVDHGANWTPFELIEQKVQKSDQGGPMPGQFIQAILTPDSKELEELVADPRYSWLRDMVVNSKRDYGSLRKYQQASRDVFDSIALAPIGDSGAYALIGKSENCDKPELQNMAKAPADLIAAAQASQEEIIARLIDEELYRFSSILWSTLMQDAQTPAKRKQIIMGALSGFWDFLNSILDAMGPAAIKRQKRQGDETTQPKEEQMDETQIQELVAKAFDAKAAELMAKFEETKLPAESTEKSASIAEVVKSVTDLAAIVTDVKASVSALEKKSTETKPEPEVSTEKKDESQAAEFAALKSQIDELGAKLASFQHTIPVVPPAGEGADKEKTQGDPADWTWDMFRRV